MRIRSLLMPATRLPLSTTRDDGPPAALLASPTAGKVRLYTQSRLPSSRPGPLFPHATAGPARSSRVDSGAGRRPAAVVDSGVGGVSGSSAERRSAMPSPFPGVDPYLEAQESWEDFHAKFINYA